MITGNVAIAGGSGFLGRELISQLAQSGFNIRVLCRNTDYAKSLRILGEPGQINLISGNINNKKKLSLLMKDCDVFINLVGILSEFGSQNFKMIHIEGAKNLALTASEEGIKTFIHITPMGASLSSKSYNARTRAEGENKIREIIPNVSVLRPSIIFGKEDSFFIRFAKMAKLSPILPLPSGGRTLFNPVFVKDVAKSIHLIIENEKLQGKTYDLGGPEIYSFRELMEFINNNIKNPRILLPLNYYLLLIPAFIMSFLPSPVLTVDQLRQLKIDNIPDKSNLSFKDLDIIPVSVSDKMPKYLSKY